VTLEFDIPLVMQARPPGTAHETARAGKGSGGSADQCGDGIFGSTTWRFSPLAVQDTGSSITAQLVHDIHQILLGMMDIGLQGQSPTGNATHYGQGGQHGQPLTFETTVSLLYSPDEPVQCGVLANLNLPSAGPLAGAQVSWAAGGLDKYGTVTYAPASGTTGPDGASTLMFQPKDETDATGPAHTDSGTAKVSVSSVTMPKADPAFASLFNLAGLTPLTFTWQVSYHGSEA
jgi:hypothetical protein